MNVSATTAALIICAGIVGYGIAHLNATPERKDSKDVPGGFEKDEKEIVLTEEKKAGGGKKKKVKGKKNDVTPVEQKKPEPLEEEEKQLAPAPTASKSKKKKKKAASAQVSAPESLVEEEKKPAQPNQMRPLAERVLPKPRKTKVDDMLEEADKPPTLARVMRVTDSSTPSASKPTVQTELPKSSPPTEAPKPVQTESSPPTQTEPQPAPGFLDDYEDIRASEVDEEEEWGFVPVKSRRGRRTSSPTNTTKPPAKAPETLTKKQRQNARRREADKSAKQEAEVQRQDTLAKHRKELEKERIKELWGSGKGGKEAKATVNEGGKLVWD